MDGINIVIFGNLDDLIDGEICLHWGSVWSSDLVGFISFVSMESKLVLFTVEGDRSNSVFLASSKDSDGNFTSVAAHEPLDRVWSRGLKESC